jgi:hypothetical protein
MYAVLKQQQQMDSMQQQIMDMQGTIDLLNNFLAHHASSQADSNEQHESRALQSAADDNELEWQSGEEDELVEDVMPAVASNSLPTRANSAPTAPSSKRQHRGDRKAAASKSTNNGAHSRR